MIYIVEAACSEHSFIAFTEPCLVPFTKKGDLKHHDAS